jgi:hypothetical protein
MSLMVLCLGIPLSRQSFPLEKKARESRLGRPSLHKWPCQLPAVAERIAKPSGPLGA